MVITNKKRSETQKGFCDSCHIIIFLLSNTQFSKSKEGYEDIVGEAAEHSRPKHGNQIRGLGTDVAIVQSMVFVAQFCLSLCMGSIVQAVGSTVAVVVSACILSFLGSLMATQVLYAGL